MSKQDTLYPRTAAQLERQYNFGKSFSEVMGIAKDAQTHAYQAEQTVNEWSQRVETDFGDIYAELELKIGNDENDKIVSMLNASADVITLNSNRLVINSDHFSLTADGEVTATSGLIGKWDISPEGISKLTDNYLVKIFAPTSKDDFVISCANVVGGVAKDTPFSLKADGSFYCKGGYFEGEVTATKGSFEGVITSRATTGTRSTIIDAGKISINGAWEVENEIQIKFLLMEFQAINGTKNGLYAVGQFDDNNPSIIHWTGIAVDTIA